MDRVNRQKKRNNLRASPARSPLYSPPDPLPPRAIALLPPASPTPPGVTESPSSRPFTPQEGWDRWGRTFILKMQSGGWRSRVLPFAGLPDAPPQLLDLDRPGSAISEEAMARLSLAGSIPWSGYNGISLQYDLLQYRSNILAVYSHCIERDNIYAATAATPTHCTYCIETVRQQFNTRTSTSLACNYHPFIYLFKLVFFVVWHIHAV